MALTKEQREQVGKNIYASALNWMAFESLAKFAQALDITSPDDKRELLSLIKKVTSAREGLVRYSTGAEYRCLVGIMINVNFDAVTLSLAGVRWELFWPDGKPAVFNEKKMTWE